MNQYQSDYKDYVYRMNNPQIWEELQYQHNIKLKSIRDQWKYDFLVQHVINLFGV